MSAVSKFGPMVDESPRVRIAPEPTTYLSNLGAFSSWIADRASDVLPGTWQTDSASAFAAMFAIVTSENTDTMLDHLGKIRPIGDIDPRPILNPDWKDETDAEQQPAKVLPATMTHQPTNLGEYKTYRHGVTIRDNEGNVARPVDIRQDTEVWLKASVSYSLERTDYTLPATDDNAWTVIETPRHWLRIPNPDEFDFRPLGSDERMFSEMGRIEPETDTQRGVAPSLLVGKPRVANLVARQDTYKRQAKRDVTEMPTKRRDHLALHRAGWVYSSDVVVDRLAMSFRGRLIVGHEASVLMADDGGRATTLAGRVQQANERAEAIATVPDADIADVAFARLRAGWVGFRLRGESGVLVSVSRASGSPSVTVSFKRPGVKRAQTRCTDDAYVAAAIRRRIG